MIATKEKDPHLQQKEFPKVKSDKMTVLIGTNYAEIINNITHVTTVFQLPLK